jgi:hypothetical protein
MSPPSFPKVDKELEEFLHDHSKLNRMSEVEFRAILIQQYGSLETAMEIIKPAFMEIQAATDRAFLLSQQQPTIGVSPQ